MMDLRAVNVVIRVVKLAKITHALVKCSDTESAGAYTLFHKVKFGLVKTFYTCFQMSTSIKGLSAMNVAKRYAINSKTAMSLMHKVGKAMKSSENHPMQSEIHVDEWETKKLDIPEGVI